MKNTLVLVFVLLCINGYSQKRITAYLEIRGTVDILGNINLDNINKPKKLAKTDSLINYTELNKTVLSLKEPIRIINKLSEIGWSLVSVVRITGDKNGNPNSPFIVYYLKKDFEHNE